MGKIKRVRLKQSTAITAHIFGRKYDLKMTVSSTRRSTSHDFYLQQKLQVCLNAIVLQIEFYLLSDCVGFFLIGAKTYWHMTTNSTQPALESDSNLIPAPYSPKFRQNLMVGNLGMSDVVVETWFGTESIYVHLINFLPVTSISAALFDKSYVEEERRLIGESGLIEDAWRGYDICNHAISDPNEAWLEAQGLSSLTLDSGLSKSQVLFWVGTRDGFLSSTTVEAVPEVLPVTDDQVLNSSLSEHNAESRCATHKSCVSQGLSGFCCPTSEGVLLNCCH